MRRWFAAFVVLFPLATASADTGSGSGSGAGSGSGRAHRPPMKAAFDACAKAKQGDTCSFHGRNHQLTGTCETPHTGGKDLVCRPQHGSGGSGNGSGSAH